MGQSLACACKVWPVLVWIAIISRIGYEGVKYYRIKDLEQQLIQVDQEIVKRNEKLKTDALALYDYHHNFPADCRDHLYGAFRDHLSDCRETVVNNLNWWKY